MIGINESTISNAMDKEPLVSIVVPIYGVERFVCECIESIIKQTYRNLEIILVDDGSPDNCPELCDKYAELDSRIIVVHQKNSGVSLARNNALSIITGKYLVFIDGDDAVESNYVETVVALMENRNLDGVIIEATLMDESSTIVGTRFHQVDHYEEVLPENVLALILTDEIGSQPWKCAYRARCWDGVWFPVGRIYEDIATTFKAYTNMRLPVAFLPQKLYRYRLNSKGISLSDNNSAAKKIYHIYLGFLEQYQYAAVHMGTDVKAKCLANTATYAGNILSTFESVSKEYQEAVCFLRKHSVEIIRNPYLKGKKYVKLLVLIMFPQVAKLIKRYRKGL